MFCSLYFHFFVYPLWRMWKWISTTRTFNGLNLHMEHIKVVPCYFISNASIACRSRLLHSITEPIMNMKIWNWMWLFKKEMLHIFGQIFFSLLSTWIANVTCAMHWAHIVILNEVKKRICYTFFNLSLNSNFHYAFGLRVVMHKQQWWNNQKKRFTFGNFVIFKCI